MRCGVAPKVFATIRSLVIGLLAQTEHRSAPEANREFLVYPARALPLFGLPIIIMK